MSLRVSVPVQTQYTRLLLHLFSCRFTCPNPLHDESIAEMVFQEAKTLVSPFMKEAIPRGLPQAAAI